MIRLFLLAEVAEDQLPAEAKISYWESQRRRKDKGLDRPPPSLYGFCPRTGKSTRSSTSEPGFLLCFLPCSSLKQSPPQCHQLGHLPVTGVTGSCWRWAKWGRHDSYTCPQLLSADQTWGSSQFPVQLDQHHSACYELPAGWGF